MRLALNGSPLVVLLAVCLNAHGQEQAAPASCDLPKLLVLPPKDAIAGNEPKIRDEAKVYFDGIAAYSLCLQAALVAAGGEAAPALVRRVLIARNNAAVDEAQLMMTRFTATFGASTPLATAPPLPAAQPATR